MPSAAEWEAARAVSSGAKPNLRDLAWKKLAEHIAQLVERETVLVPPADAGSYREAATDTPVSNDDDGKVWFALTHPSATDFEHVVGNVAEYVTRKAPTQTTEDAVSQAAIAGGSALAALTGPDAWISPLPETETGRPYSDVGLRLAFTAPVETAAGQLVAIVRDQPYLGPAR